MDITAFFNRLIHKYPRTFIVETTNNCNLRCIGCDNKIMERKKGNMKLKDFKHILGELQSISVKHIDFDLGGEPLMNPDTLKMVKLASDAGISTFFSTNATLLDRYQEEIFESGLNDILLDLDGTTKESYEKFRVGANFEKVLENITKFCRTKKARKLKTPKITIGFIVSRYNEHEIDAIKELAKSFPTDNLLIKTIHLMFEHGQEMKSLLPNDPKYSRYSTIGKRRCVWIYKQGVILWNGDLGLCCGDIKGEYTFGNIYTTPIKELLRNGRYKERQKKIKTHKYSICQNCITNKSTGEFISIERR